MGIIVAVQEANESYYLFALSHILKKAVFSSRMVDILETQDSDDM